MGTPDFAVPCLKALVDAGHEVVCVVSQPDKPVGRKQILTPPPVKAEAQKLGIEVLQPERIKNTDFDEVLKAYNADINVVVAYGKILPKAVLESAKYGSVNVHASLLPKYRGAAPIQWAVLNGDSETGVSIMKMDEGLDTGDVILIKKTDIGENETSAQLFDRLSEIGAKALVEALSLIEKGEATYTPQPESDFGYAKMISREMSEIDFSKSAFEVHNKVRGLQTWPVAVTTIEGRSIKIHKTVHCVFKGGKAGEIVDNNKRLIVSCGDGKCLEILELQPEGKKRMDAKAYLSGNKIEIGTILGE